MCTLYTGQIRMKRKERSIVHGLDHYIHKVSIYISVCAVDSCLIESGNFHGFFVQFDCTICVTVPFLVYILMYSTFFVYIVNKYVHKSERVQSCNGFKTRPDCAKKNADYCSKHAHNAFSVLSFSVFL